MRNLLKVKTYSLARAASDMKDVGVIAHSYILRVVLVIIMEFHWFIGRVL